MKTIMMIISEADLWPSCTHWQHKLKAARACAVVQDFFCKHPARLFLGFSLRMKSKRIIAVVGSTQEKGSWKMKDYACVCVCDIEDELLSAF